MVLLAHLILTHPDWQGRQLRLLRVVENEAGMDEVPAHLDRPAQRSAHRGHDESRCVQRSILGHSDHQPPRRLCVLGNATAGTRRRRQLFPSHRSASGPVGTGGPGPKLPAACDWSRRAALQGPSLASLHFIGTVLSASSPTKSLTRNSNQQCCLIGKVVASVIGSTTRSGSVWFVGRNVGNDDGQ